MTLKDTTVSINGKVVAVTNVELTFDNDYGETRVCVEGVLTNKEETKKPEYPRWWGCDIAEGESQTFVTHHIAGPDGGEYFRKHFLGDWKYDEDEITKKEEDSMCRNEDKACAEDDGYYGGERLAQELKDLELTTDQQKLLKYGLIGRNGLITNKGKEVLLNHLLAAYTDEIVEELELLEKSKQPQKDVE